jgi:hypothetical protein
MGGKFPVDIPPNSNYIPGISDQFPLSSFAVKLLSFQDDTIHQRI